MKTFALPVAASVLPPNIANELDSVDAFFRRTVEICTNQFLEMKEFSPAIMVLGYQRKHSSKVWRRNPVLVGYTIGVASMTQSREDKAYLRDMMIDFCQKVGAFAVVKVMEMWCVRSTTLDAYEKYPDLSQHPDRIEALNFIFETAERNTMRTFEILRDSDGGVSLREEEQYSHPQSELKGEFTHWLRPPPQRGTN